MENIYEMIDIEGHAQVMADQFCEDFEIKDKESKFEVLNAFRYHFMKMTEDISKFAENWIENHSDELETKLAKFMD